jgi:beta-1,4-mannosyl-glycoprotein beta-1,4-N-acetylglucosaminyltransferase
MGQVPDTTIWATDAPPIEVRSNVYDCFTFNNEFGMLEKRLKTMWDVVDRFVIVEATVTHSGKPKTLQFHNNLERFKKWLSKITYIVVEDSPQINGSESSAWNIERHQRDAIMRGLTDCKDNDVIIVSDIDEIPNPEVIKSGYDIASLEMNLFLYDYRVKAEDPWYHAKVLTYKKLKELTPCGARYAHEHFEIPVLQNGGEHLSYFGGVNTIIEKIHNTAHRNVDIPEFTDPEHIEHCIENGLDLFGRDIKYELV